MRIRGLVDTDFSARGATLALRKGGLIDAPEEAAQVAIGHGFAEPASGQADAPAAEPEQVADEGSESLEQDDLDDLAWPEGLAAVAIAGLEGEGVLPDHVAGISDEELRKIAGVGKVSLKVLRDAFGGPDSDDEGGEGSSDPEPNE